MAGTVLGADTAVEALLEGRFRGHFHLHSCSSQKPKKGPCHLPFSLSPHPHHQVLSTPPPNCVSDIPLSSITTATDRLSPEPPEQPPDGSLISSCPPSPFSESSQGGPTLRLSYSDPFRGSHTPLGISCSRLDSSKFTAL